MVVSSSSARNKGLPRVPRSLRPIFLCCLICCLAVCLAGCAGKPPKPKPPAPAPEIASVPSEPAAKRLREAVSYYMGADYKYGGATQDGLDCSGFVMKTYERAGMKLPRTSELQFQSGKSVPKDELKYGDLVFFNQYCHSKYYHQTASILSGFFAKDEQPCHVGIYIGNGRFIHSSSSKGGVTISNMSSDCWKRSLIGVRRYLAE
jgi:cell wall-associated NlpC family hydrolase